MLKYGERVRRLTYIESAGNVNPNVFPIIEQHRPRTYILPNLLTLVWRVETPAGLDRAALFLNPDLLHMTLEVGTRVPQLDAFLADLSRRTKLLSFSFTSATPLPDKFTDWEHVFFTGTTSRSITLLSLSTMCRRTPCEP